MTAQKRRLADALLELLRCGPSEEVPDPAALLAQLPGHPAEWDPAICQSAWDRWCAEQPAVAHLASGGWRSPDAGSGHGEQKRGQRQRREAKHRERLRRGEARRERLRTRVEELVRRFGEGLPGAVNSEGEISLEEVLRAVPPAPGDDTPRASVVAELRQALVRAGYAAQDQEGAALVTPAALAGREAARRRWVETLEERLSAYLPDWLAGDGVPQTQLFAAAQAVSTRERDLVFEWAGRAGLEQWTQAEGRGRRWGSAQAAAKGRELAEEAAWVRFLSRRGTTPQLVRQAWRELGLEGEPPRRGFYARPGELPIFAEDAGPETHGLYTLGEAGLHRAPPGALPVAVQQVYSGYRFYHRYPRLYRAAELQPDSPRLLVSPRAAPGPVRLRPPRCRRVTLHVGPTNSGKTHAALAGLVLAEAGAYLAPLRLLAWEAYERLNAAGVPTSLLTGEESFAGSGARVVAATIEMLPQAAYDVVVVDEAQLVGDPERGWAWTRALALTDTVALEVCCAPEAADFLRELLTAWGDAVEVVRHERLVPLVLEDGPVSPKRLPPGSAVVAFSRTGVLRWKAAIEAAHPGAACAVIYGALPPDVRRAQTEAVRSGEAAYVAATDAIGMGLNLPLEHVYFAEAEKFDGTRKRPLTPGEVRQIAGRAGRYGLAAGGTFGALGNGVYRAIRRIAAEEPAVVDRCMWQPRLSDLEPWSPWRLGARLRAWRATVPEQLPEGIGAGQLENLLRLADRLPAAVERAEVRRAFRLITAPVSEHTLGYWMEAVRYKSVLKAPVPFVQDIGSDADLLAAERSLHEHELCLYLARRDLYRRLPDLEAIRGRRDAIAAGIHEALRQRGMAFGRCRECGTPMPPTSPYGICQECYRARRSYRFRRWNDEDEEDWDEDWEPA
ncbi:MAG: helicase-related protein [Thermaerobacter sp.]|jgi:hypothetical protein|nr:helicase-related protein [Thermaerobacter sp.]